MVLDQLDQEWPRVRVQIDTLVLEQNDRGLFGRLSTRYDLLQSSCAAERYFAIIRV